MKLNLGCGYEQLDGFTGVDIAPTDANVVRCDIEKEPLPFPDRSVDAIRAHHVIEHLWDVQLCLNECWRVLKEGGTFEVWVPYGLWDGASKPVHHQLITECWFDFLRRSDIYTRYGYRVWKLLTLERTNNGAEVHCVMTPHL